jgi:murein DD-endopeptidase MepM/ murein hydrolase activator NlpD
LPAIFNNISKRTGSRWQVRIVFIVLSAVLLWGSLNYYFVRNSYFYAVYVNGKEIGLVSTEEKLAEVLAVLHNEAAKFYGKPVLRAEEVRAERVYRPLKEENLAEITGKLRKLLNYKVLACMVTIDGRDIFPVSCEEEVNEIITLIGNAFVSKKDNILLEKIQTPEVISSHLCYCFPEGIYDAETVATVLLKGTNRKEVYLVSRGDSLWTIARNYNLSVEELVEANPQVEGGLIKPGEELDLVVPEPLVNVTTVEKATVEEEIPYDTNYTYDNSMWYMESKVVENGTSGVKEVVYQITRKNGVEIDRKKIEERVIQEPRPRVIAKGTSNIPPKGTGKFIWPVQGRGRISSGYGWRGRSFHSGIDISASSGTAVLAADSGVVVFEGWDGNYGRTIVINHGHYYTRYAHNSINQVKKGQPVKKGQVIARVGSTGNSTGPHLHFEIRTGGMYGSATNPLNFF